MKIISMPALFVIGWVAVLSNAKAVAQEVLSTPAASAATLLPGPTAPQNGAAAAESAATRAASPKPVAEPAIGDSLLIDNGLWEGADAGPCCAICGGGSCAPPDWYTEQGVRFFGRTRPRDIPLGSDLVNGATLVPLLNTRSAGPDVSVAYAMTIGHYFARDTLNRDNFIEFSYWGLNGWQDQSQINGERLQSATQTGSVQFGSLFSTFFDNSNKTQILRGFDEADHQSTFYSSFEHNLEINGRIVPRSREDRLVMQPDGRWRRECQPGRYTSYIYGLRYMQLHETFRFHSESTLKDFDAAGQLVSSNTYTGDYDVVSHNDMMGITAGTDMTFRQCRWSWGIKAKVSPCINFSDQTSLITSPDLNARRAGAKHLASFIGEVGFHASYTFLPNLVGKVGYDFMWVTGLALAAEQLQLNNDPTNRVNSNGTLFQHGLSLSAEWLW